ncbi:unnamed protein product [Arctia plantaginis]|uniref:Serpin domain-containing protein n=1 Tax=Arctia plantaginis TaxID=874455 RepID=A0A8S1A254_ARCPL|nr:unnamed protein product [Arctia plantaginis]
MMKVFVALIALFALNASVYSKYTFSTKVVDCEADYDIIQNYRDDMYEITAHLYQHIGPNAINNFVFSPLSIWITLSAIAEGLAYPEQLVMLQVLRLPTDLCARLKYYQLATSRFVSSNDVDISSIRVLVIDEGVLINSTFHQFVYKHSLIDVVSAPLRSNPDKAIEEIRRVVTVTSPNIDTSGNSVILDAVDYNGLWSTAFDDAVLERSPFYSSLGDQIGAVDIMKVKRRARISHFPALNLNCLELPVGYNDRYRMMFGIILDENAAKTVNLVTSAAMIDDFLNNVTDSYIPIEIAIPRFSLTSEYDVKAILENSGVKDLWTDPAVTRLISDPAVLPSAFVHRSTIVLDKAGLKSAEFESQLLTTEYNPAFELNFIANRPFLLWLFDAESHSVLMAGAFTKPTYSN